MDNDNLNIDLSSGEHVIVEVQRSFLGVLGIYFSTIVITLSLLFVAYILQEGSILKNSTNFDSQTTVYVSLLAAILGLMSLIVGYIAATIYWENRMFITNEAVHQVVRKGLFDKSTQRIALNRVESVKAGQKTMLQRLFGYGTLIFATEGTDVDYAITYVKSPTKYPRIFQDAQEEFISSKHDKPVSHRENKYL